MVSLFVINDRGDWWLKYVVPRNGPAEGRGILWRCMAVIQKRIKKYEEKSIGMTTFLLSCASWLGPGLKKTCYSAVLKAENDAAL